MTLKLSTLGSASATSSAAPSPPTVHVTPAGLDTVLRSSLCRDCPVGSAGCCVGPPPVDFTDVARIVALGGRDFLLGEIAAGSFERTPSGLRLRKVPPPRRSRERRRKRCIFIGRQGCTLRPEQRPASCNYYMCDASVDGEHAAEVARLRAELSARFIAYERVLVARVRERWPEGPSWDVSFLDWLGEELRHLQAEEPR